MKTNETKKVAVLYIALGRYVVFWKEFFESCEEMLLSCDKHYFIWTDCPTEQLEYGNRPNVTVIPYAKRGWPYDSLMRFEMFLQKREEILKCDYVFFFNANMQFYNPTDLSEITPREWNGGLVVRRHPGVLWYDTSNPDKHRYERRPESTAYIPFGKGKYYVSGAFNGGTSKDYIKMCEVLAENVKKDLDNDIIACVDDESHLNAYCADHDFLLLSVVYGYPEQDMKKLKPRAKSIVKMVSRDKTHHRYGGHKYLRGQTDKRASNNFLVLAIKKVLKFFGRFIACFVPYSKWRKKVRDFFTFENW
jgi:hypothetical protein